MDWCVYTSTFCLCQGMTYNFVVDWTFKKWGGGGINVCLCHGMTCNFVVDWALITIYPSDLYI